MLIRLQPSLEHDRKRVPRSLRLYGDQANAWFPLDRNRIVKTCNPSMF